MAIDRRWMLAIAAAISFLPNSSWAQADIGSEDSRNAVETNAIARRNAEIVRRYLDVLNRRDVTAAAAFYASDTVNHGIPTGARRCGACLGGYFHNLP